MSRSFPTIYRPRADQIAHVAAELLEQRITKLDYCQAVEAITEGTSANALALGDALQKAINAKDETEIGRVVMSLIRDYYRDAAEADAESWADRVEEVESETYDARELRRIKGAA